MELEEVKRLLTLRPREKLVREPIPGAPEWKVLANELVKLSRVKVADREVELPGMVKWKEQILQACQAFWEKKGEPTIMPYYLAKADDLTIAPIRPETFGADNWLQTGLTTAAGTYDILPKATSGPQSVDADEKIVITDFIEINPNGNVTAIKYEVDRVPYNTLEVRVPVRATDLHIIELPFPIVADTSFDIDGKVEFDGDAEITPLGAHICLGKRIPGLT